MKFTDLTAIISCVCGVFALLCIAVGIVTNDINLLLISIMFGVLFVFFGIVTANVDDN